MDTVSLTLALLDIGLWQVASGGAASAWQEITIKGSKASGAATLIGVVALAFGSAALAGVNSDLAMLVRLVWIGVLIAWLARHGATVAQWVQAKR